MSHISSWAHVPSAGGWLANSGQQAERVCGNAITCRFWIVRPSQWTWLRAAVFVGASCASLVRKRSRPQAATCDCVGHRSRIQQLKQSCQLGVDARYIDSGTNSPGVPSLSTTVSSLMWCFLCSGLCDTSVHARVWTSLGRGVVLGAQQYAVKRTWLHGTQSCRGLLHFTLGLQERRHVMQLPEADGLPAAAVQMQAFICQTFASMTFATQ